MIKARVRKINNIQNNEISELSCGYLQLYDNILEQLKILVHISGQKIKFQNKH